MPASRPTVSLTMIVRDEEADLPACLESCKGLFDETLIVDTGSSDDTKQIAASFGARVFDFAWCDDFAAARNETLKHATGEWAMWLDADERIDGDNREKLARLFDTGLAGGTAYRMRTIFEIPTPRMLRVRLFKRTADAKWLGRVHESLLLPGRAFPQADVEIRNHRLCSPEKSEGYRRLMELELSEGANRGELFRQLARDFLHRGDLQNAYLMFGYFLGTEPDVSEFALSDMGLCYGRLGLWDRLAVVEQALAAFESESARAVAAELAKLFPAETRRPGIIQTEWQEVDGVPVGGVIVA